MKHLLLTTIAAVLLVGCGKPQESSPQAEAKPAEPVAEVPTPPSPKAESKPVEPVAKAAKPEPPTVEAPDISISEAALNENIEAVKQHIAAGTDVNAKDIDGLTPLDWAGFSKQTEIADLIRKHGGKTGAELKAEGK